MATDGSRILFIQRVLPGEDSLASINLRQGWRGHSTSGTAPASFIVRFVEDGTELLVGNSEGNGELSYWMQPVAGGSPRRVGTALGGYARFGPDGATIIYGAPNEIYLVGQDGSSARKLLSPTVPFASPGWPFDFRFSPDQEFCGSAMEDMDSKLIMGKSRRPLRMGTGLHKMSGGWGGEWISDGWFFVFQADRIDKFDFWILPEESGFPWRKHSDKPIQLTAGPLDFESLCQEGWQEDLRYRHFASSRSRPLRLAQWRIRTLSKWNLRPRALHSLPDGQWVTYTTYPDGSLWRTDWTAVSGFSSPFHPCGLFCRAGLMMPSKSPSTPFFRTRPGIFILFRARVALRSEYSRTDQSQMDANWSPDGNSLSSPSVPGSPRTR